MQHVLVSYSGHLYIIQAHYLGLIESNTYFNHTCIITQCHQHITCSANPWRFGKESFIVKSGDWAKKGKQETKFSIWKRKCMRLWFATSHPHTQLPHKEQCEGGVYDTCDNPEARRKQPHSMNCWTAKLVTIWKKIESNLLTLSLRRRASCSAWNLSRFRWYTSPHRIQTGSPTDTCRSSATNSPKKGSLKHPSPKEWSCPSRVKAWRTLNVGISSRNSN